MGKDQSTPNKANLMNKNEIDEKIGIRESKEIIKEYVPSDKAEPMSKSEIDELYSYSSAMCKISCKILENDQIIDSFGTGFFCKIDDNNIPFKRALFTNNHILNENSIEIDKEIEFENCDNPKSIKITINRRVFTNKKLDYTCIEILDIDEINKFFLIDDTIFNNKNTLKNKEIFILQYANGGELVHDSGKIMDIDNNEIEHSVATRNGSSGSPLIKRHYTNLVIGVHFGAQRFKESENKNRYNLATPFDVIIEDIKNQLSYNKKSNINGTDIIEYENIINNKIKEKDSNEEYKSLIYYLDNIIEKGRGFFNFFDFLKNNNTCSDYFVKASIFDKTEYNHIKEELDYKLKNNNLSEYEKSCIGSILGMAIGDAIGARVEFSPLSYNYNKIKDMGNYPAGKFKLEPGQWTDDTSMGLCIADSLIENKGEFDPRDIMMRFILWWLCGYNNAFRFDNYRYNKHSVGLGGNINESFKQFIKEQGKYPYTRYGDRNTSGNGSIMRNAAIPISYFKDERKALEFAKYQSLITLQGIEAAGCCQLITFIIIKILKYKCVLGKNETLKKSLKDILKELEDFHCDAYSVNCLACSIQEGNDKNRNWNWKDSNFEYSEERAKKNPCHIGSYCMDCLSMALHVLYSTNSFKEAILKGVNLCGDADSVGSVIGQIAGAFYGLDSIPEEWIKTINKWDNNEIALRGYILCCLN